MIRIRTKPVAQHQAVHRFAIGQAVHMKSFFTTPLHADRSYIVTACLPQRDEEFQYRIRAEAERHERVAGEAALELMEAGAPVERTN